MFHLYWKLAYWQQDTWLHCFMECFKTFFWQDTLNFKANSCFLHCLCFCIVVFLHCLCFCIITCLCFCTVCVFVSAKLLFVFLFLHYLKTGALVNGCYDCICECEWLLTFNGECTQGTNTSQQCNKLVYKS